MDVPTTSTKPGSAAAPTPPFMEALMKYANRPRDYELGGFVYDPRVLAAPSWYLNHQNSALLAGGLDDDLDRQIESDLAALAEIFDSRADEIHRPVRWRDVDRLVCTCALVVRTAERLATPAGHLDLRMRPARTVVAELDDLPRYLAACQQCGSQQRRDDVAGARAWTENHTCSRVAGAEAGPEPDDGYDPVLLADGEHPDDVVHRVRTADQPGSTTNTKGETLAAHSKIVDEGEVIRWIEDGRTYRWMVEEYERKYNVAIAPSTFSNFRRRRGLDRRINRDDALIPWEVKPEHRWAYPLMMLRFEARRRANLPLNESDERRLSSWLDELRSLNAVVLYDPDTPDGFYLVPREDGDDDLIRRPTDPEHRTKRRRAD